MTDDVLLSLVLLPCRWADAPPTGAAGPARARGGNPDAEGAAGLAHVRGRHPDDDGATPAGTADDAAAAAAAEAITRASVDDQGVGPWEVVTDPAAARGTWVGVLGPGDTLEPGALRTVADLVVAGAAEGAGPGDLAVVYADERLADGRAHVKPDWMPRALDHLDALGRPTFVRADVLAAVGGLDLARPAPEWDLHLRLAEHLGPGDPLAPHPRVLHVPQVLLARGPGEVDLRGGLAAVTASLGRRGRPWTPRVDDDAGHLALRRPLESWPSVTVVVPTGGGMRPGPDGAELRSVDVALASLLEVTDYPGLDVVLVTSEGTEPDVAATWGDRVTVVEVPGPFSFSRSVNVGVGAARGELVLLLNDDTEVTDPAWLRVLVGIAAEEDVGAVGATLLFGDGTIQHAGIAMSPEHTPGHLLRGLPDVPVPAGLGTADLEHLGVTAACLLTPRAAFEEVGGFTEQLPNNFNDLDYCLKLRMIGLRSVSAGSTRLVHHESVTRDARVTDREHTAVAWWSAVTTLDPWYWGI